MADLAGQEQAGGYGESEGEDGGKVTSRTVWCPSRALGKKDGRVFKRHQDVGHGCLESTSTQEKWRFTPSPLLPSPPSSFILS